MTEEQDKTLDRYFRAARAELADEEFTSRAMQRVRRHERRSAVFQTMTWLGVLVVAWLFAPFIQSGFLLISAIPGETTLSSAGELMSLAQAPLIFMLGLAGVGYFLLDSAT
jgi:membrane protein DedA with SNARE-associated domain